MDSHHYAVSFEEADYVRDGARADVPCGAKRDGRSLSISSPGRRPKSEVSRNLTIRETNSASQCLRYFPHEFEMSERGITL
jgi:hypothetical protein